MPVNLCVRGQIVWLSVFTLTDYDRAVGDEGFSTPCKVREGHLVTNTFSIGESKDSAKG